MKRFLAIAIVLTTAVASRSDDFGTFGVERRARLSFTDSGVSFVYKVTMAESPSSAEIIAADADENGSIDETEKKIFLIRLATRVRDGFRISFDRTPAEIRLASANGDIIEKESGQKTIRAEMLFNMTLPQGWNGGYITVDDAVFPDKVGARELIVDPAPGWEIETRDGTLTDGYFLFQGPKGSGPWSARFEMIQGKKPPESAIGQTGSQAPTETAAPEKRSRRQSWLIMAMLLLAVVVGACHAIMPSHGSSLVSAYLVGPHNTIRHAALLGWVLTAIRTTPVFAVGVALMTLDRYLLPAKTVETMRILCALSVAIAGLFIVVWHKLTRRTPEPPMPHGVSTSEVVALGIAGSFVPSPSAMALLFTAVSMGQSLLGLGMVVAFGVGLELMMTTAGLIRVMSPSLADGLEDFADKTRGMRLIWGLIILAVGVGSLIVLW